MKANVTWKVEDDAAWICESDGIYRHYSGTRLSRKGGFWHTTSRDGAISSPQRTAIKAIEAKGSGFWFFRGFGQFGRSTYGDATFYCGFVSGEDHQFVVYAEPEGTFPSFLISSIKRRFVGQARCIRCESPMGVFQTRLIGLFDGSSDDLQPYLVCSCGYPVWHMQYRDYKPAFESLEQCARPWRRKQALLKAGGKHTRADIDKIRELQGGRCIYCDVVFSPEQPPTRDHILPLVYGGGDGALNIVLACRPCNSRRCNIPFRTFCRLLSAEQNLRIRKYLARRIMAVNLGTVSDQEIDELDAGLRLHDTSEWRYKMMSKMKPFRVNLERNKLMPAGLIGLLRESLRSKTLK